MTKTGPLYIQISNQIRKDIIDGKYAIGTMLPTEAQLEKMFNVSKITVRNAVEILSNEGYVAKKSGRGTTVISNRLFSKLKNAASFSRVLENELETERKVVSCDVIEATKDDPYYDTLGPRYIRLVKNVVTKDKVSSCFVYYFRYFDITEQDIAYVEENSLYLFLAEKNYEVASVREEVEIVDVDYKPEVYNIFKDQATVILRRSRKVYDSINQLVGVHIAYIDTKVFPYTVEFEL